MIFRSFGNLIACTITMGSKHTLFPKLKTRPLLKCAHGSVNSQGAFSEKQLHTPRAQFCNNPLQTSGDPLIIWSFGNMIACTMTMGSKHTSFPKFDESDLSQSVPMGASTRKDRFERKKLHCQRYSFCNNPHQASGDPVIIWSIGNMISCTMTMGSKHTLFPKLKNRTSPKVCPWKRQLTKSVLREKNSIRGGTHFATIPIKRPEIL